MSEELAPCPTSIDEMCAILEEHLIESCERTDCAVLYTVTFEQLRALYDRGRRPQPDTVHQTSAPLVGWVRDDDSASEPSFIRGAARPPGDLTGHYRPVVYSTAAALPEGWQAIETAPKDGTLVLLHRPTALPWGVVTMGKWTGDQFAKRPRPFWEMWLGIGSISEARSWEPKHWRPLPQPPGSAAPARPAPQVPEGWQAVPKEPTQEMIDAMGDFEPHRDRTLIGMFKAAVSAAPPAPAAQPVQPSARMLTQDEIYKCLVPTPVADHQPRSMFDVYRSVLRKFAEVNGIVLTDTEGKGKP